MNETLDMNVNGEWVNVTKFKTGDRVENSSGDIGTVINVENGGVFVNINWDDNEPIRLGKTWTANNLKLIN